MEHRMNSRTSLDDLGNALNAGALDSELKDASLAIAHACRESLDKSWGINAWAAPDEAASGSKRAP
jgi:hypothetical protein